MSEEQYYDDDEEFQYCGLGNKKRMTKNEKIYGDFYEAYDEQPAQKNNNDYSNLFQESYDNFKIGEKIENYSAQIQVDIPVSKKKNEKNKQQQKPRIGQFTMQSFLNTVNQGLDRIDEEDNQSRSCEESVKGLNENVMEKLKLVKIGEDQSEEEEQIDLNNYLEMQRGQLGGKKKKPKKTEHQKQLEKQLVSGYGIGYKMLQKMGYTVGAGLGKDEQGKQTPVQAQFKTALTAKDKPEKQKKKRKDSQSSSQNEQERNQKQEPKYENPFEEMFLYRSKDPVINTFLFRLKNKYQILKQKIGFYDHQNENLKRELQISQNMKIQKQNEVNNLSGEVDGLRDVQQNIYGFEKHPHLGLSYNADLLIVKQSLQKLRIMNMPQLIQNLDKELSKTYKLLYDFYISKQKESLKDFNSVSGLYKATTIDLTKFEMEITTISFQDQEKLNNYINLLIEESVVKKISSQCRKCKDISKCPQSVVDLLQIVKKHDKKKVLLNQVISQYIKPLANKYLSVCPLQNPNILPHLVIFSWMTIISINELEIEKFIKRICRFMWKLDNDDLYNLITPWLNYIDQKRSKFFINFYLSPRLLYEMENFELGSENQKQKVKGFIKYGSLLPQETRQEILKNSLMLKLIQTYKIQKTRSNQSDLQEWLKHWQKKLQKLSSKIFKKVLPEYNINIWT